MIGIVETIAGAIIAGTVRLIYVNKKKNKKKVVADERKNL